MKTYRTIIAGSRTITDPAAVEAAVKASGFRITEVVSGCASGPDTLGEQWARRRMIPIKRFPADWRAYGKGAGWRRNQQMADYADQLIAIWDRTSRGTRDMVERAEHCGLAVFVYRPAGAQEGGKP